MTEAAAHGSPGALDLDQTRAALASSSTTARIAQLRGVDEKIVHKCGWPCSLLPTSYPHKYPGTAS